MTESPMADLNRRLVEEANLLDAAHRWTMASMGCAVALVLTSAAAFYFGPLFMWQPLLAVVMGAIAHMRASVLVGRAKVLRELREGH